MDKLEDLLVHAGPEVSLVYVLALASSTEMGSVYRKKFDLHPALT